MSQKSFNVNPAQGTDTVEITPANAAINQEPDVNWQYDIIIPRATDLITGLDAQIDEGDETVDIPNVDESDGDFDLDTKWNLIKVDGAVPVTNNTFTIGDIYGKISTNPWVKLNKSNSRREIIKQSGQVPDKIRVELICNPAGASATLLENGEEYQATLDSVMDAKQWKFVTKFSSTTLPEDTL
jgi:hypothetical protein